ncbi:unnamed protein product [Meloidogyne enterolobii]|uniref:Uncharacterized protein n=1 Tax=Meloidogyne enterolobii TaxID=390850 RepID=A0ACB1A7M0_MELEN
MGKLKAWGCCEVIQKVGELDIKLDALWQAMVYCFLKENGKEKKSKKKQQHLLVPFSIGKLYVGPRLLTNELEDETALRMHFSIKLDEGMARGNFWIEEKGRNNREEILMFGEDLLFRKLDIGEIDKIEMKIDNNFDSDVS